MNFVPKCSVLEKGREKEREKKREKKERKDRQKENFSGNTGFTAGGQQVQQNCFW